MSINNQCNCKSNCNNPFCKNKHSNTNNSNYVNKQMHFNINNTSIYLIFEQINDDFNAILLINNEEPMYITNLDEYKKIEEYLLSKSK